ncbi:exo-beta-N-acetylmuramidase NamZ family protein [Planococcus sp. SE5232]|uniref:exo-beta-N-acetylmuramidase NamZ family protein n=1 Tax=unclassified Planococcus (in: firmicutes) TaxID=2662419 RepID=UPI003D6A4617
MKKWIALLTTILLVLTSLSIAFADHDRGNGKSKDKRKDHKEFELGIEVLMEEQKELISGKNVGLITNPTGVDQELNSIVDLLDKDPEVNLTALYGPEHGVRGDAQAGQYVDYYIDEVTGVPVYSLYGKTRKPTPEMLEGIDVLIFDIQDVGARFYTYIYTMALAMEAAEEQGIPFIVLDRPNPLGGTKVEGPVLDPAFASFVGQYAIPLRHGMTVGELAEFFNAEIGIGGDLTVVEMMGWKRNSFYDETGLQFVPPSPNMPTLDTALVYPGTALIEGTNVSEGRGTTKPFEFIGAPFINSTELAEALNALELPGVSFRAASFTPAFSKHASQLSHGIQVHVTDRESYLPIETGLHIVKTIYDLYPEQVQLTAFFNNLIGNDWISQGIKEGMTVEEMKERWQGELKEFKEVRREYLLY